MELYELNEEEDLLHTIFNEDVVGDILDRGMEYVKESR